MENNDKTNITEEMSDFDKEYGIGAVISIELDELFLDILKEQINITNAKELKGYLKGVWEAYLSEDSLGPLVKHVNLKVEVKE